MTFVTRKCYYSNTPKFISFYSYSSVMSSQHDDLASMVQQSQLVRKNSERSPRSGHASVRRPSMSSPQVVNVPMPTHTAVRKSFSESLSPNRSILLAPPEFGHFPDQRRYSVNVENVDRLNNRQKAKRSQSVMYRQGRRRSTHKNAKPDSVSEHDSMIHRRRSVRM